MVQLYLHLKACPPLLIPYTPMRVHTTLAVGTPVTIGSPNNHPWIHSVRGCPVVVFISPLRIFFWTPYVYGRHTYPIKVVYPTVIYVDRGHIRYRSFWDERWIPRSVGVTAVLVRGPRDAISILLGGLNYNRTPYGLDAIRTPPRYHMADQMPKTSMTYIRL